MEGGREVGRKEGGMQHQHGWCFTFTLLKGGHNVGGDPRLTHILGQTNRLPWYASDPHFVGDSRGWTSFNFLEYN